MTWIGPELLALRTITIALDGADFNCSVDGMGVPTRLSWLVRAGSVIRFGQAGPTAGHARAYLAIAGGFDVPPVLGSRSTYLPAGFGGFAGRPLRASDVLGVGTSALPAPSHAGKRWPEGHIPATYDEV